MNDRQSVKSSLVYWHDGCGYWPLEYGPGCPGDHSDDIPIYDHRGRQGRKRRVWICEKGEASVCYLTRQDFLDHDEEACYA